jgi:2-oxoglutarate dehydrogenase E1 component
MLRRWRKPLIVLTPKSMLRHPASASPLDALARGEFLRVIAEPRPEADRVLLCTGKIGHELRRERDRRNERTTAIVTLEELYPFPEAELAAALQSVARAGELVWVQEEPANMGARAHVLPILERLAEGRGIRSVSREESGSPATGSSAVHEREQAELMDRSFSRQESPVSHFGKLT